MHDVSDGRGRTKTRGQAFMCLSNDDFAQDGILQMDRRIHILLVDQDSNERSAIASYLRSLTLHVELAQSANEMRLQLARANFDLVVLEPGLVNEDGLAVFRDLRRHCDVPVIILSRAGSDLDRILGLEMGAEDYIVKPSPPLTSTSFINGEVAFLLPCLGRSERDKQVSGNQAVTMEDSLSCIHGSLGKNKPASVDGGVKCPTSDI